jgi:galactokinase
VNLIGEHTDYNLGFVLPIAIHLACYVAVAPNTDGKLRVYSQNEDDQREWDSAGLTDLEPARHWTDYVIGVARELLLAGVRVEAADLAIYSTVPVGSGLSSSAALEVSSAFALGGAGMPPMEIARLCQRAEVQFVGMPCGIMDQYVAVFGREHAALEIDCRTLQHQPVTLPGAVRIVAVNTMVKHELGTSAYRQRVEECSAAVKIIQGRHALVKSLRDVSDDHLREMAPLMPQVVLKRARHVVGENKRVEQFVGASGRGALEEMGGLFVDSHRSLQHDYEVSCEELDFLVDTAITIPGVYGSRMTGGGFGGCTVNLVADEAVDGFKQRIREAYMHRYRIDPPMYDCVPSAGAAEVQV